MHSKRFVSFASLLMVFAFVAAACASPTATATALPAATSAATSAATTAATEAATAAATQAGFSIPDIETGKFNVAVVLVGFHADGGWSQAHVEGSQWLTTQDAT